MKLTAIQARALRWILDAPAGYRFGIRTGIRTATVDVLVRKGLVSVNDGRAYAAPSVIEGPRYNPNRMTRGK
jgi:hypothetical protein